MATATAPAQALPSIPGRRYDKVFFSGMAFLMIGVVFVGFARTYFLKGVFAAPLPSAIIHVHGAVFVLWAFLFATQATLVAKGNVVLHRKLGLWAFGLAATMVILGAVAATNSLGRHFSPIPVFDAQTFYAVPIMAIVAFAVLIACGYAQRNNSALHKRFVLLATIDLMGAPTGRPPFTAITGHPHTAGAVVYALIFLLIAYDLWSQRKVLSATIWGAVTVIIFNEAAIPIGLSGPWHSMANAILRVTHG